MPLRLESPLVRVEPASFHTIDTSNVENLMGMWSASHAGVVTRPNASRCPARPELVRRGSNDHRSRGKEKHITPIDLEKIVISIKEKKELEPLSHYLYLWHTRSRIVVVPLKDAPRSRTYTDPQDSRSSVEDGAVEEEGATFTLGGSSDEDGTSSLETHMLKTNRSSLSEGLRRPGLSNGKTTSFNDKVTSIQSESYDSNDEALDSDDGEEEEPSESAIEDDDDEAWEDSESESESGPSSVNENGLFQRVESRPNLTSRRSMLTALMHEPDRQKALQNAASRSTPAMRRSRTSSPNGPSLASSPKDDESGLEMCGAAVPRSKPIIMTTSNVHPPALSPRTTRRNMLTTELTESLRKHLLWERQQKNATSNAALKRRHTSQDVKNLKQYPEPVVLHGGPPITLKDEAAKNNNSWNAFFDHGLQEYHEKGW
ncbi:hypothetical protein H2199_005844 [Coniosporium tulheliwenetii]|uniref:Uncharacterized protein n=1 Tax=Coniosporium tulheliwenetii TaxID=3383036 RepID=A0ACC2YZ44_9PEZI|nr:hypothetical protein H2199_005844 [Cladosporium sp. JES 115]